MGLKKYLMADLVALVAQELGSLAGLPPQGVPHLQELRVLLDLLAVHPLVQALLALPLQLLLGQRWPRQPQEVAQKLEARLVELPRAHLAVPQTYLNLHHLLPLLLLDLAPQISTLRQ